MTTSFTTGLTVDKIRKLRDIYNPTAQTKESIETQEKVKIEYEKYQRKQLFSLQECLLSGPNYAPAEAKEDVLRFKDLIRENNSNGDYNLYLGNAYDALGMYHEAEKEYRSIIDKNKTLLENRLDDIFINLVDISLKNGKYEQAIYYAGEFMDFISNNITNEEIDRFPEERLYLYGRILEIVGFRDKADSIFYGFEDMQKMLGR